MTTNKLEQAARQSFETWWESEGQEFLYALNTTTDDDIKLVAEVAWKNGAYCAEQAEQDHFAASGKPIAEQEPVAWVNKERTRSIEWLKIAPEHGTKLYSHPVRTKDLTDDEIEALFPKPWSELMTIKEFVRAVIAADREKNK